MAYPKLILMVKSLEARTSEGSVEWQETTQDGVFQANFPRYSVRVFRRPSAEEHSDYDFLIQIRNQNGAVVEEVSDIDLRGSELSPTDAFRLMRSLFDGARRTAMGIDQALDEILKTLEKPF